MAVSLRTEKDVEANLLAPLFHDTLGYPTSDLEWARSVPVTFGRETRTKFADLVVCHNGDPVIAVEAKKPTEPVRSGLGQVDSYAFALQTPYSVITNGRQFLLRGYYSFNSRINVVDETVDVLAKDRWRKLKKLIGFGSIRSAMEQKANEVAEPDQEKIQDYRRFFRRIHNEIRDRDKLDPAAAFDELSKLLFLKAAEDEWRLTAKSKSVLTPEKVAEWDALGRGKALTLVNEWFRTATTELFPDVFDDNPRISLSPATLQAVLTMMKPFHVKNGDVDVKGRAFEEFLPSQLRGKGLGQFFTPRPIVNFMADAAAISIQDVVVDFSCGSGGFLIKAFEQMKKYVDQLPPAILRRMGTTHDELLDGIKAEQIFGVDAEPRAARTAKMNMIMWGDGRRVVRGNALDTRDHIGNEYEPSEYDPKAKGSGCTLILANPPFGSKEKDQEILKRYELAGAKKSQKAGRTEVLFIEKGLKLLRPEGKMLIVLPQGLMSSESNGRVRDFIHSEAEIRAIVSLPTHTFSQSGVPTVNTCVVYLQKFTNEKKSLYTTKADGKSQADVRKMLRSDPDFDYPIFMGSAEYVGYEPSGRMIAKPGEKTDLDLLLEDFWSGQPGDPVTEVDVFDYANKHYGDRSHVRKDQTIRGTDRGMKMSFIVQLSQTVERLDPTYYFFLRQAGQLIDALKPLAGTIKERKGVFRAKTDAELDSEYDVLSVSSDGRVSLKDRQRGEDFSRMRKVRTGDIVYNPMRVNIGSIGVVPAALDGGLVSPDYVVFESTGLDPDFLVMLLRSPFYRMYIDVISTGSIRDRLYFKNLRTMRVPDVGDMDQVAACAMAQRADEAHSILARIAEEKARAVERLNQLVRAPGDEKGETAVAFRSLADRWHREAGMLSSMTKKFGHPAYQKIIALGKPALPHILQELRDRPAYWFKALEAIAGTSPIPEGQRTDLTGATDAWLKWGVEMGYLK